MLSVLVANRCDLARKVSRAEVLGYLAEYAQIGAKLSYFEASSEFNINVMESVSFAVATASIPWSYSY